MSTISNNTYSDITTSINENIGWYGRMIAGSKSEYTRSNPNGLPVFNSNIIVNGTKVWYGDIDVVFEYPILQEIAKTHNIELYVLREMDARFETESTPKLDNAVAVIHPSGEVYVDKRYHELLPDICKKNNFLIR